MVNVRKHKVEKIKAALNKGWVIANHILVSFHVAFISSILSVPGIVHNRGEVLRFMFASRETFISIAFWYLTFHVGVAWHEIGHYLAAIRLNALNAALLPEAQKQINQPLGKRIFFYLTIFLKIPFGKLKGITRIGLEYHPDAPYNLAVSAAGPKASRNLSIIALPIAFVLLFVGLRFDVRIVVYIGRLFLGIGLVGLLDFLLADPGKYKEFKERESAAAKAAMKAKATVTKGEKKWKDRVKDIKEMMIWTRMQKVVLSGRREILVPWEFRNCGMGGRHTEKEFPESNISLQESMFIPFGAKDYEEAQEMTVNLQTRLKEIIENSEGCTVKGIGTEGGIAAYIEKEPGDVLPVQRLWRMQKQAILDCGYVPGKDVLMALDPAASELETAYRKSTGVSKEIGTYQAWRDESQPVLSRDELFEIYRKAIEDDELPIISVEDGFAEDDDEGWKLIMEKLGDKIHIIGDDNITTKDSSIEEKADKGLINTALIKLNQIGTVTEGTLAIMTAIGKKLETVVSHRSKSPIEDFEAQVALASNSLGLKAGGGSNSERLFKYESIVRIMREIIERSKDNQKKLQNSSGEDERADEFVDNLSITEVVAREASTNAGIPTVAVEIKVGIPGSEKYEKLFTFEGATPLGTSAGSDEAIHLIDSIIPAGSPLAKKYPDLFTIMSDKTYRFNKDVTDEKIAAASDRELQEIWQRAKRYRGKGCLNAVDNVNNIISKVILGKKVSELGELYELDHMLLEIEEKIAIERGTLSPQSGKEERIHIMQRKGNLGMNAILSVSLALARLKGAMEGKGLWEVMREQMSDTMSKVITYYGGENILDILEERLINHRKTLAKYSKETEQVNIKQELDNIIKKLKSLKADKKAFYKVLKRELTFSELSIGLQIVNENKAQNVKLYELLREHLPVYGVK